MPLPVTEIPQGAKEMLHGPKYRLAFDIHRSWLSFDLEEGYLSFIQLSVTLTIILKRCRMLQKTSTYQLFCPQSCPQPRKELQTDATMNGRTKYRQQKAEIQELDGLDKLLHFGVHLNFKCT